MSTRSLAEVLLTFGILFTPAFFELRIFGDGRDSLLLNTKSPIRFSVCIVRHLRSGWNFFTRTSARVTSYPSGT